MANVEKITQKDYFKVIIASLGGEVDGEVKDIPEEDIIKFLKGRIALLDKKSSNRKTTKNDEEKAKYIALIKEALAGGEPMTATAIMKTINATGTLAETSIQRVTALLKKLVEAGEVVRDKDKKSVMFSLAVDNTTEDDTTE